MKEHFVIRFQLINKNNPIKICQEYDHFDMEIPERVSGVLSSKEETPFLVSKAFFEMLRKRLEK